MSLTPEDEMKLFKAKELARKAFSAINQGFVAAGEQEDPYGYGFGKVEQEAVVRLVAEALEGLHKKVKEARASGVSRTQLYGYKKVDLARGIVPQAIKIERAACERLLAALNANADLFAWTEDVLDGVFVVGVALWLDFSRLHAGSLTSQVKLDSID